MSNRVCQALFLIVICQPLLVNAQKFETPLSLSLANLDSSGIDGDDESNKVGVSDEIYRATRGEVRHVDPQRLVVEWGDVSVGYLNYQPETEFDGPDYFSHRLAIWSPNTPLHPDRQLGIRGRILEVSEDGKSRHPFDGHLGVRVMVSRLPEKQYDWSKRQEVTDAVWEDVIIYRNGEFLALVSPGDLLRPVYQEAKFQVALSLGKESEGMITFRNTNGVLPQSVTMLSIPGPQPISRSMQIINGAPSFQQEDFNPAKLVRAINHLVPLGKEKALKELREFLKIARDEAWDQTERIDENIDTSDNTCLFLIVNLLFEYDQAAEGGLGIVPYASSPMPATEDLVFWPKYPLHLEGDLPFLLASGGFSTGGPDQPIRHLDWAEEHGKIRTTLLKPIDNPLVAAGKIAKLPQSKRLYADVREEQWGIDDLFYGQAWNILQEADQERIAHGSKSRLPSEPEETLEWKVRVTEGLKLKMHWDETEQKYHLDD